MESSVSDRRTRAKKACLACNARRVRCNVLEMQPCRNCVAWNLSCELGVSRRGKYPRKKRASLGPTSIDTPNVLEAQQGQHHRGSQYDPSAHPTTGEDTIQKTVFLGESSPLTCVVDEGHRSPEKGYAGSVQQGRLHYSIPEHRETIDCSQDLLGQRRKLAHARLTRDGALNFPSPAICDTLLHAYFEWFHPCFPILDRPAVHQSYRDGMISPLLLQAMLFIGVSLCADTALTTTGFNDRYQTKGVFYQRAKEIYDVGWETDTVVKLQSLFLLSCWRGGPTEERDVRFWLGAAINLAQKKGMHIMSKLSFLSANDQKIWKRIWWALYVRDQQTSAALGLPSRIRDEDCEVADLEPSDFEESDSSVPSEIFRQPPNAHVSYVIGMVQLARLLREVVLSQYLPGRSKLESPSRPLLHQRLMDWESNLPKDMRFNPSMSRDVMFLIGMLHMAYNNLFILLYRPVFLQPPGVSTSSEGNVALDAATRSTRILEDMLSGNLVQHGSLHLITHTFSALCIHTIHFGRVTGTARKLAEHRAKLCLLGLKELQKSWDLENWVLNLFFRCLDDRTAQDLRLTELSSTSSHHLAGEGCDATSRNPPHENAQPPFSPRADDGSLLTPQADSSQNIAEDASVNMDWYDLFNVEGDGFLGLAGSFSNPDYLNPQNLEFLYRFL
ncbi:hypothetical protein NUU61_007547 [Penicillium alfredii]|uniref:Zn(2)-C6 fungal-type domain-containing protein n=1 Tax=Penicillium alfredii TaxID=1506179 RepID=A0A9W9EQX9_9EURO|nr:uncharacterized protein NUU61_007547 [Penicillium alfredii]KAJ5086240.1 hypothetical protein NUU61_007547 [Penicillium alfredii]